MAGTVDKVLGTIGAMETLIMNFPMSILDGGGNFNLKCAFDFLLKILAMCGVNVQEIIQRVLQKVFGIEQQIQGGIDAIYDAIANMEINEQSKFFQALEYAVKGVLMALLTSIFSCDVLPILPDKYMDIGKYDDNFTDAMRQVIKNYSQKLSFPLQSIDMFGYFNINPVSDEGQMYYSVEGKTSFYEKTKTEDREIVPAGVIETRPEAHAIYLDFGFGHDVYVQKTASLIQNPNQEHEDLEDCLIFCIDEPMDEDINISIVVTNKLNERRVLNATIQRGDMISDTLNITPFIQGYVGNNNEGGKVDYFTGEISVTSTESVDPEIEVDYQNCEGNEYECLCGDKFVFFSYERSEDVKNFWLSRNNASIISLENCSGDYEDAPIFRRTTEEEEYLISTTYSYRKTDLKPKDAKKVKVIPEYVNSESPDFISCREGIDTTSLYKTKDMNAFIWYVINQSNSIPQVEKNKCMWDNRLIAKKRYGLERGTSSEWNEWYNSKNEEVKELILGTDPNDKRLHPIIQLYRDENYPTVLHVEFPAQQYFKPKAKSTDNEFTYQFLRVNTTTYKFNWEYLENITIFNPKLILRNMFDALLNGALSTLMGLKPNLTKKKTEQKISNAIVKYINALDTEVEDCYYTFSNEEFDKLLEDALLAKFSATTTNGDFPTVQQHDISQYFSDIEEINSNATKAGQIDSIMKTVTDVSATKGSGAEIDYGLELGYDESWWKNILQSLAMAIIQSMLTPQVVLLILINFQIMGITSKDDIMVPDQEKIVSLVVNKIIGLIKAIINFIKDKLLEILLEFVYEKILPLITKYMVLIGLEKIQAWIDLLLDSLNCIMMFKLGFSKSLNQIDEVNYADIVTDQIIPESNETC